MADFVGQLKTIRVSRPLDPREVIWWEIDTKKYMGVQLNIINEDEESVRIIYVHKGVPTVVGKELITVEAGDKLFGIYWDKLEFQALATVIDVPIVEAGKQYKAKITGKINFLLEPQTDKESEFFKAIHTDANQYFLSSIGDECLSDTLKKKIRFKINGYLEECIDTYDADAPIALPIDNAKIDELLVKVLPKHINFDDFSLKITRVNLFEPLRISEKNPL